jgi:carbon monoxide dehydrogenase subunit G
VDISSKAASKFVQRAGERIEEVREVKIKIKPVKEGVESYVTLSAHGEAQGGIPQLVSDFQEMVKKYLVEQVGIPDVKKIEVRVTKIF